MIFVEGKKTSEDSSMEKGHQLVLNLLQHPILSEKANVLKSLSETTITIPKDPKSTDFESSSAVKSVYVFQREYATVDPSAVELVGTDEATTCVGLVISNRTTRMTSVAHFDSPEIVKLGLLQMLAGIVCGEKDADLDVHLLGGFDDTHGRHFNKIFKNENSMTNNAHSCDGALILDQYKEKLVLDGYSWPLCLKIVETMQGMPQNFHLQTFCVLNHNTSTGPKGESCPIIRGFVVYYQMETRDQPLSNNSSIQVYYQMETRDQPFSNNSSIQAMDAFPFTFFSVLFCLYSVFTQIFMLGARTLRNI